METDGSKRQACAVCGSVWTGIETGDLARRIRELESALVSVGIERDHLRATVRELVRSDRYAGGAEERGLNDMAGVLHGR